MKKLYGLLLTLMVMLSLCASAGAATITSGLWKYETFTGTNGLTQARLVGPVSKTSTSYTVPSTLGGYTVTEIGYGAFQDCDNATTITLPSTITKLGKYALSDCDKLTSVKLSEGLLEIAESCFRASMALKDIHIPQSCTIIGNDAFTSTYVEHIYLGDRCTVMNGNAFAYTYGGTPTFHCSFGSDTAKRLGYIGYGFETADGCQYRFVDAEGTGVYDELVLGKIPNNGATSYTVPSQIGGYTVIGLNETFCGWSQLEHVYMPSTIKMLVDDVFAGCTSLKEMNLPNGLEVMGDGVFFGCASLTEITFPASLTMSTGESLFERCTSLKSFTFPANFELESTRRTFYDCTALESVTMPSTITKLDLYTFKNCTALTKVSIPATVTEIGYGVFDTCSSLKNFTLPNKLETVGMNAFNMTPLQDFTLPTSIKQIGRSAFNFVTVKNTFYLPEGITELGDYCFNGAKNLPAYLALPSTVTKLGSLIFTNATKWAIPEGQSNEGLLSGLNYRFMQSNMVISGSTLEYYVPAKYVSTVQIPAGITAIADEAFTHAYTYTVKLPEGLVSIGKNAFKGLSMAGYLTLPSTVKTIGDGAFSGTKIRLYPLPEGLASIGENAFDSMTVASGAPGQLYIPRSVTSIGANAFPKDLKLLVEQGSHAQSFAAQNGYACGIRKGDFTLSADGTELFEYLGTATEVTVPAGVKVIHAAFHSKDTITAVTLPEGLTTVGERAFYNCHSLKDIRLPDTVTELGKQAFYCCESLESVYLPEGITAIREETFLLCEALKELTIPASVTSIEDAAFMMCNAALILPDNMTSIAQYAIETYPYCKAGTLTAKALSELNISFNDGDWRKIQLLDGHGKATDKVKAVKYIGTATDVIVPDDFDEIGNGVFSGTKVVTVTWPEKFPVLPPYTFSSCEALTTVNLPDNMTTISTEAFRWCEKLHTITWPQSLTSIGSGAFDRCFELRTIHLPEGITSLPANTFPQSLNAIRSIIIPKNFSGALGGIEYLRGIYNTTSIYVTVYSNSFDPATLLQNSRYVMLSASRNSTAYTAFQKYSTATYKHKFFQFEAPVMSYVTCNNGRDVSAGWSTATSDEQYAFYVHSAPEQYGDYSLRFMTYYRYTGNFACDHSEWYKVQSHYYHGEEKIYTEFSAPMKTDYYTLKTSGSMITGYTGSDKVFYVPKDFTVLGSNAFAGRTSLEEVVLHDGVTTIYGGAFRGCTKLKTLELGRNLLTVEGNPFDSCPALTLTVYPDTAGAACALRNSIPYRMMPGGVDLPDALTLYLAADVDFCQLSGKLLPAGCVQEAITYASSDESVATISKAGLITAVSTGECVITASVASGAETSFTLKVVTPGTFILPASMTEVLPETFLGDASITYVRIPGHITAIGAGAWKGCGSLTCVYIPAAVAEIAADAFADCPHLTIYCPAGSAAQAYAQSEGIPCQSR